MFSSPLAWILHAGIRSQIPLHRHPELKDGSGGWIVIPELMTAEMMSQSIDYARRLGYRVAVLVHDCIAYFHPEWVNQRIRENHRGYLMACARADIVIPNSTDTEKHFRLFCENEKLIVPEVKTVPLAEELLGKSREKKEFRKDSKKIKFLYVSTLDPRKNHLGLVEALRELRKRELKTTWECELIGFPYDGGFDIAAEVGRAMDEGLLTWRQGVTEDELESAYRECDFTVFPSFAEGFGLPIVESWWMGRPVVCSRDGAMGELGGKGGACLVDVRSPKSIADGLQRMIEDSEYRGLLNEEVLRRTPRSWKQYADEFLDVLLATP